MLGAKSKSIAIIALTACLLAVMIPLARAQEPAGTTESFIVYTDKPTYELGETVNVYVKAVSIDPGSDITVQDITVYGPDNAVAAEWHGLNIVLTDTETIQQVGTLIPTMDGTYTVDASGTGCPFILKWICFFCWRRPCQKVPEAPLGTIVVAAAMLGATGLYIKKKASKNKKQGS
jgi:hypothetical protein